MVPLRLKVLCVPDSTTRNHRDISVLVVLHGKRKEAAKARLRTKEDWGARERAWLPRVARLWRSEKGKEREDSSTTTALPCVCPSEFRRSPETLVAKSPPEGADFPTEFFANDPPFGYTGAKYSVKIQCELHPFSVRKTTCNPVNLGTIVRMVSLAKSKKTQISLRSWVPWDNDFFFVYLT